MRDALKKRRTHNSTPAAQSETFNVSSVVLVTRDPHQALAWRSELTAGQQHEVVGITNSALSAQQLLREHRPRVVITDLRLLDGTAMAMIQWLAGETEATRPTIIVVAPDGKDPLLYQALSAGADNLHIAGQGQLLDTLSSTLRGETALTPSLALALLDQFDRSLRTMSQWAALDATESPLQLEPQERELLQRVAAGYSVDQLAEQRNVHPRLLGQRARHIVRKLQWDQRAGALQLA
jgi:DNA-binding NarL/FixJ family response regulator